MQRAVHVVPGKLNIGRREVDLRQSLLELAEAQLDDAATGRPGIQSTTRRHEVQDALRVLIPCVPKRDASNVCDQVHLATRHGIASQAVDAVVSAKQHEVVVVRD